MINLPYHYCLVLAIFVVAATSPANQQVPPPVRVCGSMRYTRHFGFFSSDSNPLECNVVFGDVDIISRIPAEEYLVFPKMTEITGYLLVYEAEGLLSLGRMFPNLRTIGGQRTISNYSLIVAENPDLKDIGLTNLERISQGGVAIIQNPKLCFVDSVNWRKLTVEKKSGVFNHENNDGCPVETRCALNASAAELAGCELLEGNKTACWNALQCQKAFPLEGAIDEITDSLQNSTGRDVVDSETIWVGGNGDGSRTITWRAPSYPNGRIRSYMLYLEGGNVQQPSVITIHIGGVEAPAYPNRVVQNVPKGDWRLTIRTETDAGLGAPSKPIRFNVL